MNTVQVMELDADATPQQIEALAFERGRPTVLRQAAAHWPALRTLNLQGMRERLGQESVVIGDNFGATRRARRQRMDAFIDYVRAADEADEGPRWYTINFAPFGSHPELLQEFEFPRQWENLLPEGEPLAAPWYLATFGWMFVGPSGTFTFPHEDLLNTHAWLAQIEGRKLVNFPGPGQDAQWRQSPGVELHPGDLLIIPAQVRHSAFSLTPSVSLTFNFVTRHNLAAFEAAKLACPELWQRKRHPGPAE